MGGGDGGDQAASMMNLAMATMLSAAVSAEGGGAGGEGSADGGGAGWNICAHCILGLGDSLLCYQISIEN